MKLPSESKPSSPPIEDEQNPGVPLFRSWGGVYAFVLGCFVVVIVLLTIFSRVYA